MGHLALTNAGTTSRRSMVQGEGRRYPLQLAVVGRFALDPKANPPSLKPIELDQAQQPFVRLGEHVRLRPDPRLPTFEALLNLRVEIDPHQHHGLGGVVGGCPVFCASNYCREWAIRNRRPRMVGKVVGVMADVPTYILLTQPKLKSSDRSRRESRANRTEAGFVHFVLFEAARIECPECPGPNVGEVVVEP